ncbi:beta strand repeat-containing protein [Frondihabitans sucicola]|uniref:beta strand repeat-containing protein n=1 Tax=Frondihabitans sucicola TaxID=1268041 RepID=UPI002572C78B|nr:isopeptide-forming domain-containing fimbrial protein [Frondihabitans sucicola]
MTGWFTRPLAAVLAILLVAIGLAVVPSQAAQAANTMTLTATSSGSVLAGQPATVTLTATNPTATDEYNASFRYVLPAGVTYVAGSAGTDAGDPTIVTITDSAGPPAVTHQVLVWQNLSDLSAGSSSSVGFQVQSTAPVGSTFTGTASAYAQSDPRTIPAFDANGNAVAGTYTDSATAISSATTISALKVTKSEPSPEHELMRGVHDQPTVYTLTVENTADAATAGVTLVDYLPAGLEFLGCGAVDNSTAGAVEYSGAPRLDQTYPTALPASVCPQPVSVVTVSNPAGQPAGVYTAVTWSLGAISSTTPQTIQYVAAVPLRANTTTWSGTAPSAASLGQTANLDNNTGALTRQVGGATAYTNSAVATGTYTGPVASGASTTVSATDSVTIKASDLSIVKSSDSTSFVAGRLSAYSLLVRSSEYVSDIGMTITDVQDDGLCPAVPADTPRSGDPVPADCDPSRTPSVAGTITNATATNVAYDASTGKFTLTLVPTAATLAPNSSVTIGYSVLMRAAYSTTGLPTAAGDSFTNDVRIAGTSTSVPATGQTPSTEPVTDTSSFTKTTTGPTISKKILPRTAVSGVADCAADSHAGDYVSTETTSGPAFQLGDRVCFQLTVRFSADTLTRNARITDFLPSDAAYEDSALGDAGTGNTLPAGQYSAPTTRTSRAAWTLGSTRQGLSGLYVDQGVTAVIYVSALVTSPASTATTPDVQGNLMKYSETNTAGQALSLRDRANFRVAPAPQLALAKTIVSDSTDPVAGPVTRATAREGSVLGYRVDVSNVGTAAQGNDVQTDNVTVWDALPAGVTCAAVSAISNLGSCSDTPPLGIVPSQSSASVIVWTIPTIAASSDSAVTYTLTVPAGVSVSTSLTNQASVVAFGSPTTDTSTGDPAEAAFYPAASLSATNSALSNAQTANGSATVTVPATTVTKTGLVGSATTYETAVDKAVQGQSVSYQYGVTVPRATTVYSGVLTDPGISGIIGASPTYLVTLPDGTTQGPGTFSFGGGSFTLSPTGTLTFPATYDDTAADQTFTVQVTGLEVDPATSLGTKTNTATFTSTVSTASDAAAVPPQSASKSIAVVAPVPTLTKTASPSTGVAAGQSITFALTAGNTAGSPPGYDSVIVDCLPVGLTYQSFNSTTSGVALASNSPGDQTTPVIGTSELCPTGTTRLVFSIGTLAPGATTLVNVIATVDSTAVSSDTYTNNAKVVTSTLPNGVRDSTVEGVEATAAQATVTVVAPTVNKTVSAPKVAAGGTVSYTVESSVPANVTLFDPTLTDQLPAGMSLSGTATCTLDGTPIACAPLTTTTAANRTTIGWTFPRITAGTAIRKLTVTFAVQLSTTVSTARGTALSNTALLKWNSSEKGAPTSVTATFDRSVPSNSASTTVTTPAVTVAKTVTPPGGTASGAAMAKPGDVFTYAVTATNAANANASAAFDTVIKDVVPTGVIVDPSSLASNGTLSGQTATGGGTITWTGVTIAAGGSKTYTYAATFAASATLHATALTNTANVASYNSVEGAGVAYGPGTAATAKVTPTVPRVTIAKSAAAGTLAYVGQPFPWRVAFANAGAAATTLTPTDTLPANWTYVPGSATYSVASGAAQAIADPTVTTAGGVQTLAFGNLGSLPGAGTTSELDYQAVPTAAATQTPGTGAANPHVNSVSAVSTDPTGASQDADNSYTGPAATASAVIQSADIAVVKSAADPLVAGTTVTAWKLTVSNNGGNTAVGPFTVTDDPTTLPGDVTITRASGDGWSCTTPDGSGAFTCTRTDATDTLASGASFPAISVAAATDSDASVESVTNSASVTAKTFDPDTTNNTSSSTVSTVQQADLAVSKTVGSVHAGSTVTWQLGVSNLGPSTSRSGITVTDPIPSGVSDVAASGTDWTCDITTGTVVCTLTADLSAGTPAPPILLTGTVASSFTGTLSNSATVTGRTTDPNPLNNSASASATVDTATTLSVAKTLVSSTVEPGSDVSFAVAVTNTGTSDARTVSVTDSLPAGLTYVSSSSTTGTWTCSETATSPSTATCDLQGSLSASAGSSVATVVIVAHVPADLTTPITNVATAHADNAPDSSGTFTNGSTPRTAFSLTKTHPAGDIRAGQDISYTLTATNDGPSDAPAGTTVTDTLPSDFTYSSATGDGWDCSAAAQVITCTTQATAAVGAAFPSIAVVASTDPTLDPGTYTNTAAVTGPGAPSTVFASDPTVITTAATLHVDKTVTSGSTVPAGTLATYDVTVTNDGPSAARSVSLADVTPVGMTTVSISGDGWTCDDSAGSCTDALVPPGTTTLHVTARVASSVPNDTVLTNRANLAWTDTQGSYTDSSTADVTVNAAAALALTKTAVDASGAPVDAADAGDLQRYALVATNAGPSDAVGP